MRGGVETSHDKHCALSEIPRPTLGMTEQKKDDRTKENKNKKRTTNLFTNKNKREMKTRTLFVTALLGLGMMASCSNDELEGVDNGQNNNGETTLTQIALSVASSATTKAGTQGETEFGEENEYTIENGKLMVVFADKNGIAQVVEKPTLKTATNNNEADKMIRVTEPFDVPAGEYYVYVIANFDEKALSPIIEGQTDLKQVFSILDASKLSTSGAFLMTNETAPTKPEDLTKATDTEKNDAGSNESDSPETLKLISVSIERAVAKVTFAKNSSGNTGASDSQFEIEDDNSSTIAKVTLNSVGLINLNKKMYLVKGNETATAPSGVSTSWAYPIDPNYNATTDLTNNFSNPSVGNDDWKDVFATGTKFYCPENTMVAAQQLNGVTTGVVYKATWTMETGYPYTTADKEGSDFYSRRFAAVLAVASGTLDSKITESIFTTAHTASGAEPEGTFFAYNDLVFKNKYAAILYKAMDDATGNDSEIGGAVNTQFKNILYKEGSTERTAAELEEQGIHTYLGGVCYYPVWIKHNPTETGNMAQGKYGVVRNHWYELTVTGISNLGNSQPTYEKPEEPDDPAVARIQVQANIKKWTRVYQDVEL